MKIGIRNIVIPGGAQADHGRDHVDRAEDRAQAADNETGDPQVRADARRVDGVRERGVGEPAEVRRAARGQEARQHDQATEEVQPVRESVEPGERHIRCADL